MEKRERKVFPLKKAVKLTKGLGNSYALKEANEGSNN